MELTDTRMIKASPDMVWAALLDPEVLMACVPGCTEMSGSVETGFEATVKQKIGPVSATFKGVVQISDVVEGQSCTISGEGKGGAAGFAKGGAKVALTPVDGGTELSYEVEAKVGGKIAQLGSRIIDGVARKLADEFFARFQATLEGPETPDATEESEGTPKKKGWFQRFKAD